VVNCADNSSHKGLETQPIRQVIGTVLTRTQQDQFSRERHLQKLCRTYLLCGYQAPSLTLGLTVKNSDIDIPFLFLLNISLSRDIRRKWASIFEQLDMIHANGPKSLFGKTAKDTI
jgi:hypothetical protein